MRRHGTQRATFRKLFRVGAVDVTDFARKRTMTKYLTALGVVLAMILLPAQARTLNGVEIDETERRGLRGFKALSQTRPGRQARPS